MGSNRFYISILINCLLIFGAAFLFFYFLQVRQQPNTAAGIAVLAILLTIRLVLFVNRTNRILGNFLSYMHEKDPSLHFSMRYVEKNFQGLNEELEKLIREFKENRIDLEVQAQYLATILDNVSTGILSFNEGGEILTMNQAAHECLGTSRVNHLKDLDKKHGEMGAAIQGMWPADQLTITVKHGATDKRISIHTSQIKLKKETVRIVALNDITHQMEEQEILSWKKLIRVINHEIMNSMTPIITLAMAIRRKLSKEETDAIHSASIIEERSIALVHFIERYKKLTTLPPIKPERFLAEDLFARTEQLFKEELETKGIRFIRQASCNIELEADRQMLEQVLINLVKNAAEALQETKNPEIELFCQLESDQGLYISIRDNGEGIPAEKQEQVFVPFFTTREKGSGIGLNLCRQIIRLHKGQIHIESIPGEGTSVILRFPA